MHTSEQPIYEGRTNTHTHTHTYTHAYIIHTYHIYIHKIILSMYRHICTDINFVYALAFSHLILLV